MSTVFIAFTLKNSSVAEFFVCLANRLAQNQQVVIFSHATEDHDLVIDESIAILHWPSKRPTKLADFIFLKEKIKSYQPTVLIASFGAVNVFMLVGYLLGVRNRIAWYHTLTTQLKYDQFLFFRKKFIYSLSTKIISNSIAGKLDVANAFGISENKINVVPNAVRDPLIKNKPITEKLVYVGRLNTIKGIFVLIKAIGIVREIYPGIKLEIIGGEDEEGLLEETKQLCEELELKNHIHFVGNKSKEYVLNAFSEAYIAIVPSYYEAFGYVVIESFSVHCPVVGSNTTGIAEIVESGFSGLLFEPGNHEDLGAKLLEILSDKNLRDKYAAQAYDSFLENYELNRVVNNFVRNSPIFN